MTEYKYTKGDLVNNPNTYFYTDFKGIDFLTQWMANRDQVLESIAIEEMSDHGGNGYNIISLNEISKDFQNGDPILTKKLLISIRHELKSVEGSIDETLEQWLDVLVKKFEVTKRVHEAYGKGFLAVDKSKNRDFDLYIFLAEIFSLAYRKTKSLIFLNALLKINDTLCSIHEGLIERQLKRVKKILIDERRVVVDLADKLGVEL